MPWNVVEHTADVGLEATGPTLEAAIADLVAGFGALVCPEGEVAPTTEREIEVRADELDALVVDLLDEINYIHQVEHFVPAEAAIDLDEDDRRARVLLRGEAYDPDTHGHLMEIKATTYHGFEIEQDPARIHVLFDV